MEREKGVTDDFPSSNMKSRREKVIKRKRGKEENRTRSEEVARERVCREREGTYE